MGLPSIATIDRRSLAALCVRVGAYGAFAAILFYFALTARGFTSSFNLLNVVEQSAILGVLSFAMTVVFIGTGTDVQKGGIDLSIAANAGLCAAIFVSVLKLGYAEPVAVMAALGSGTLIGLLNGLAVVTFRVMPLLATLAVLNVAAGLELTITENSVVSVESQMLTTLSFGRFLGVSALAWCLILFSTVMIVLIHYTPFGLRLYAVGGHLESSRVAGLHTGAYIYASYLFSGLCAGFASILIVSRLSASTPGTGLLLLPILAAALLGTVFSRRFVPTIGGTILAVLFIGFLANGFQLLGISSYWVNGVQGALILLVVSVTSFARRAEET